MPQYNIRVHTSAERELDGLIDEQRERLVDELAAVARTRQPTSHESARLLEGQSDLFRVRVGAVRAVCVLEKPDLFVLKVGHRDGVYDGVDSVQDRLDAAEV